MLDKKWLLEFRTDYLTSFFQYFPLLASDHFFITAIALGYWLRPSSIIFKSLGFLVPFSIIFNCLLKNIFHIPRPDISLHLIPVFDPFGFPSGDVQVGVIFWGYILIHIKHPIFLKYACLAPIIGIAISRVYLGVHSVYDVIGGIVTGLLILYVWIQFIGSLLHNSSSSIIKRYWIF